MKKETKDTGPTGDFYRLVRTERNMFTVESITLENGKVIKVEADEPSFLPISFDKLRRRTGEAFFKAVNDEHSPN